jgi:quercetin dioxygenase-like cupin family protein
MENTMESTVATPQTTPQFISVQLRDLIEYAPAGVLSKVILKYHACQQTLLCLAAGTDISEHTSTQNAVVHVLEGRGILTLNGQDIKLEPDVLIFMSANTPHAVKADENLAFLLTLSKAECRGHSNS